MRRSLLQYLSRRGSAYLRIVLCLAIVASGLPSSNRVSLGQSTGDDQDIAAPTAGQVQSPPALEFAPAAPSVEEPVQAPGTLVGYVRDADSQVVLAGVRVVAVGVPDPLPGYRIFLPVILKDRAGAPVDSASAAALRAPALSALVTFTTTTGSNGAFSLAVPPGAYTITLSIANYTIDMRTSRVKANQVSRAQDVNLHPLDPRVAPIGASGGVITNSLGNTSLQFPAGALGKTEQARVTYLPNNKLPGYFPDGSAPMGFASLEPAGAVFPVGKEVLWTVEYTGTLPVGTNTLCYWWDGATGRWRDPVPGKVVDLGGGKKALQARVPHFSAYGHAVPGIAGQQPGQGGAATVTQANSGQGTCQTECKGSDINAGTGSLAESYSFLPVNSKGFPVMLGLRFSSSNDTPTVTARVPFTITTQTPASAEWSIEFQGNVYSGAGYDAQANWNTLNALGQRVAPGLYPFRATGTFYYDSGARPSLFVTGTVEVRRGDIWPFGFNWMSTYDSLIVDRSDTATLIMGDGQYLTYVRRADGTYTPPAQDFSALVRHPNGTWTRTTKQRIVEQYNIDGRLTQISDTNGNTQSLGYEPTGAVIPVGGWGLSTRLTSIRDASGRTTTLTYGPDGYVSSVSDGIGRSYALAHDPAGNLTSITDPLGRVTTYVYGADHLLTGYTLADGSSTTLEFDGQRRVVRRTDAQGNVRTTTYGDGVTTTSDELGNLTTYQANAYGAIERVTNAAGSVNYTWNDERRLESTDQPPQRFKYDERGNVIEQSGAVRAAAGFNLTYNKPITSSDSADNVTTYGYNGRGNLVVLTDPLGNVYRYAYDNSGQLVQVTDPLSQTTAMEYDGFGNVIRSTDRLGNQTTYTYDAAGNLTGVTDAEGRTSTMTYDVMGRVKTSTDPLGRVEQYEYDAASRVTRVTDAANHSTTLVYDSLGQLVRESDAIGGVITYTYDAAGNLTARKDANGAVTFAAYDALNRLATRQIAGAGTLTYRYDAINNMLGHRNDVADVSFVYENAMPGLPDVVETRLITPNITSVIRYDLIVPEASAAAVAPLVNAVAVVAEPPSSAVVPVGPASSAAVVGASPTTPGGEDPARSAARAFPEERSEPAGPPPVQEPAVGPGLPPEDKPYEAEQTALSTNVGGTINANATWTLANSPYVVTSDVTVAPGVTLTVEPGVVVKLSPITSISVNGRLLANATSGSPIYFTSLKDDTVGGDTNGDGAASQPAPGNWRSLRFTATSSGSVLNNVTVRYGGEWLGDNVYVNTRSITLTNSTIALSSVRGLYLDKALPAALSNNRFISNTDVAVWAQLVNSSDSIVLSGNTGQGNRVNGVALGGTISGTVVWDGDDQFPFVVWSDDLTVNAGGRLSLTAGTVVKFATYQSLWVSGALLADTTPASPIIFTSLKDDAVGGDTNGDGAASQPAPGNWRSLRFTSTSSGSVLNNAIVRYGGDWYADNIYVNTRSITLTNSTIALSSVRGLYLDNVLPPALSNNRFISNTDVAVWARLSNNSDSIVLSGNTAQGNLINGLALGGTVTGTVVWDGDDAFPFVLWEDIAVNAGARLSLTARTVVKARPYRSLWVSGALVADTTAGSPIIFTSLKDDAVGGDTNADGAASQPAPGDWRSLRFLAASSGSVLNNAIVRYGGDWYADNIYVNTRAITITNSTIALSSVRGLYLDNTLPAALTNNRFVSNTDVAVWARLSNNSDSIVLSGNTAQGNLINGLALGGTVTGTVVWDGDDAFPFVMWEELTVNAGARLSLAAGTVVKARPYRSLWVSGALVADTTAGSPIIFTSLKDDAVGGDTNADSAATTPAAGDWRSLRFLAGSSGSVLNNAIVRYGGDWYADNIYVNTRAITITNSTIALSSVRGLYLDNTLPPALRNNRFISNTDVAVWARLVNNSDSIVLSGNTGQGNGVNGFALGGTISGTVVWDGDDQFPFVVWSDDLTVNAGGQLTLTPDTIIKFNTYRSLWVSGALLADTTPASPIVFTSFKDDTVGGDTNGDGAASQPAPGNWRSLRFLAVSSGSVLNNATVRYGGEWYGENLYLNTSDITVTNSAILRSSWRGIQVDARSPSLTGNTISYNRIGVNTANGAQPVLRNNRIFGNTDYGVYNTHSSLVVDAEKNWWGSPTGPLDSSDDRSTGGLYNPGGSGDRVSNRVDYEPWLSMTGLIYGMTIATGSNPEIAVRYSYDALNRLTTLAASGPAVFTQRLAYDALGRLVAEGNAVVSSTMQYDANSRLTRLTQKRTSGAILSDIRLTYDRSDTILTVTDGSGVTSYGYDAAIQLTSANGPGLNESYTYDAAGNRLTKNGIVYAYNAANQLVSSSDGATYTYDANGSLRTRTIGGQTTTYTWDGAGRLVRIDFPDSSHAAYTYDGMNHRVSKRDRSGVITYYVYNGMDLVQEVNAGGVVIASYVYEAMDRPISMTRGGSTYYYIYDQLGSVIGLADSAGALVATYRYDPWGNVIASGGSNPTLANPFRYTGREWDAESGLYYLRARYYDAQAGRFISRDAAGVLASMNLYTYVGNDPVNNTDTLGLDRWWRRFGQGAAALATGAVVAGGLILFAPVSVPAVLWGAGSIAVGTLAGGAVAGAHEAVFVPKCDPTRDVKGAIIGGVKAGFAGAATAGVILYGAGAAGAGWATSWGEAGSAAWASGQGMVGQAGNSVRAISQFIKDYRAAKAARAVFEAAPHAASLAQIEAAIAARQFLFGVEVMGILGVTGVTMTGSFAAWLYGQLMY